MLRHRSRSLGSLAVAQGSHSIVTACQDRVIGNADGRYDDAEVCRNMLAIKHWVDFDRRSLLIGLSTSLVGLALPAHALELTTSKVEQIIQLALKKQKTTPLSRADILGFTEERLTTKSIEISVLRNKHGFMVVIPQQADGLVLFATQSTGKPLSAEGANKPLSFGIHRTGKDLTRIASALNQGGTLVQWSGPEAEHDFAEQIAFWAKIRFPD